MKGREVHEMPRKLSKKVTYFPFLPFGTLPDLRNEHNIVVAFTNISIKV